MSMSETSWEYKRPFGDQIARTYGIAAYNETKVENIKADLSFDVLCSDGKNYAAVVKNVQGKLILHYKHWSKRQDYYGPMDALYLAEEGLFSIESAQNKYFEIKDEKGNECRKKWNRKAFNDNENTSAKYYPERKKPRISRTKALQIISPLSTSHVYFEDQLNERKSIILVEEGPNICASALSPHKPGRVALNRLPNRSAANIDIQMEEIFEPLISFEDNNCEALSIDAQKEQTFKTLISLDDEAAEVLFLNNNYTINCTSFRLLVFDKHKSYVRKLIILEESC
jgi:hypothetical protein